MLSNPVLKLSCFLLLSVNCSTYLVCQCLCSRITALWHFINFVSLLSVLLLLSLLHFLAGSYLEEVEEGDGWGGVAEIRRVLEEEHAREFGVDDVGMAQRHLHEVQSLLATVSTTPERQRTLVLPCRTSVGLYRHHIKHHPDTSHVHTHTNTNHHHHHFHVYFKCINHMFVDLFNLIIAQNHQTWLSG